MKVAENWHVFLPPARPSISELAIYERIIMRLVRKKKDLKIATLGSTPEFRDLCQTCCVDYRCIDYSRENFLSLGKYMIHPDGEERLIVSDWRNMSFAGNFDLFIGDLVTTVTPVADHAIIFKNIKKHCKEGALVILKTPLRPDDNRLSHEEIFSVYRKKLSHINPFTAVWHEVLLSDYDFHKDSMNCMNSKMKLEESFKKGIITEYEFGEFRKRWDVLGNFNMNIPRKDKFIRDAGRFFKIQQITSGHDCYRKWAPILIFKN